jgi:hypothetical protein
LYFFANQATPEALDGEDRLRVINLNIMQGPASGDAKVG